MANRSGRERREAESLMSYWDARRADADSGLAVTPLALDLAAIGQTEWSHRFLIALGPSRDDAALLHYGANFAQLFQIPPDCKPPLEIGQWLPDPHPQIFLGGCRDAIRRSDPVLLQRVIDRGDGRREMFRCCFIPLAAGPEAGVRFVLGAYNSRSVDHAG